MATSRHLWTRDLLKLLSARGTYYNALSIIAQIQAEGGSAHFNPLNTTLPMPGATDYNDVHVKNYVSYAQGLDATVQTLKQANMVKLLTELKRGTSSRSYWVALGESPWGTKPPGTMGIDAFLDDVRNNWYDRAMLTIAGT